MKTQTVPELTDFPLFADVEPQILRGLQENARHVEYEPGDTLYKQSEASHTASLIASGFTKVRQHVNGGNHQITALHGPGALIGIEAVLAGIDHRQDVVALGDVPVLHLEAAAIHDAVERSQSLYKAILGELSARSVAWQFRLTGRSYSSAAATFHRLIVEMDGRLALRRGELAQLIGSSPKTVTRILGEWKRRELVLEDEHGRLIPSAEFCASAGQCPVQFAGETVI